MEKGVIEAFQAWMASVGIEVADSIRLTGAAAGTLGVQAARDIAEGERLCTIPKAACISVRTTELADVIEAEELGGGLGLVLAVLHEMSLGQRSKWHGYFQALQRREYLPLFWSDAQLALLRGTELEGKVEADREAAAEDFREHVLPLLAKHPGRLVDEFVTLEHFHVAASYVASRAFGVDEWHGDAMVPLADIFNHKASVVELGEGYEVHGADASSDDSEQGEAEEDERDAGSSGEEDGGGGSGSDSEGEAAEAGQARDGRRRKQHRHEPGSGCCGDPEHEQDHHGHGEHEHDEQRGQRNGHEPAAAEGAAAAAGAGGGVGSLPAVTSGGTARIYGIESANGLHLRLQMGIVDRDEDTLEIVAASAIPAAAEVHNTYGELGNAELTKKYGFALRQNPFTAVGLDKQRLLAAARAALGPRRWRARSRLLQEQTEVLEEEEEPFEALPNGHISPALYVALRVLGASDAELASWRSIGDALRLPPAAADGGSQAQGGAGSKDDGEEEDGEGEEEPQLGAVQVWRVLDAEGQPLPEAMPAQQAANSALPPAAAGAGSEGGYAALLPAAMWQLLAEAVKQRQAAYAAPLEADLQQLAELERQQARQGAQQAQQAQRPPDEAEVAERAALLLRITEKEVLRDLLAAIQLRLAAMGTCEATAAGGAAEEEEKAPSGQGRGKARGRKAAAAGEGGGAAVPGGSPAARKRKQR
ncbi:hypothetical protein ABPG77_004093 [Micractinium sp. CCAP 211/92]